MATAALVLAATVALLSAPTVAGLTPWGLAGGDGEPRNALLGGLARRGGPAAGTVEPA